MALMFANSGLLVYMDDVIVCSANLDAHLHLLEDIFRALQAGRLTLKQSKVRFGPKDVKYIGHVLSTDDTHIGDNRIKLIIGLPKPTNIREVR